LEGRDEAPVNVRRLHSLDVHHSGFLDDAIRISHSDISEWIRCRRRFDWGYIQDIQPPLKLWGPLACGNRVHEAVQIFWLRGTDPRDAFQALAERDEQVLMDMDVPGWAMDEFYTDVILGRNCCVAYYNWLRDEGPYDGYKVASEQVLQAPFLAGQVRLIGKVDLFLTREIDGAIATDDIKTASPHTRTSLPPTLEKSYQHVVYQCLVNLLTSGRVVGDAFYTVLYKLKVPERALHPMVERFHVPGLTSALPRRIKQLEAICADMLEFISRVNDERAYPTPADSCRWCDYKHPCQLQDEVPLGAASMLTAEFTRGGRHARYDADIEGEE